MGTDSNLSYEPPILISLKSCDTKQDLYSRSGAKSIQYGERAFVDLVKKNAFKFGGGGGVSILEVRGWWTEGDK